MILKNPYAVFIKYFKLFHAIMAVFMALVLYGCFTIYRFFVAYCADYRAAMGNFSVDRYLNIYSFLFPIIVLILTTILLFVLFYKKKPKAFYIYNFILYVLVIILYYFCYLALNNVNSIILNIRVSKAFRDFSLIAFILQSISFLLVVIRATGFDIKRFDFLTDLEQLDITSKDSEEIEVSLEFDKDKFNRNFRSMLRHTKYFCVEHKFVISMVLLIFVFAISFFAYINLKIYNASYKQGKSFRLGKIVLNVSDAYILDSDISGNKLLNLDKSNDGVLVAVRFKVKSSSVNQIFNTGLVTLKIGDFSYVQNGKYASQLYDLGTAYVDQKLSSDFETYILTFEIPKVQASRNMILKFNDNSRLASSKNIFVKIKPIDLRKDGEIFESKLTEKVKFDDSILGKSSLTIDNYEINNKFKLEYEYCYGINKCMTSYEYVTPTATGNYSKTLLKISGDFSLDKDLNIREIYDIRTFLNNFGVISYKVNDVWKSQKISSEPVKVNVAKVENSYVEIPLEVKDSSEVYLTFKIRNQRYKYVLK